VTLYQPRFWKYYFAILIPYYVITQILLADSKINSPKTKGFISMWTHPYDSQIYGAMKLNLTRLEQFLKEYSQSHGVKIGYTVFMMKLAAMIYSKFPQVNGNVIFGKFVSKPTIDISCMVATEGGTETDMITVKNCDKLSMEEITKKISDKKEAIEKKLEKAYNNRMFMAKILPTL
jgi:hypothetical protein